MSLPGIPEVISDFNLYLSGNRLAGVTDEVSIPEFEAMTQVISGVGILGEYEAPIPGHFGSMEQSIKFRCINEDYFRMVDPTAALELTLRGDIMQTDKTNQATTHVGMRVVFRGKPKKVAIGTVKQRASMDSEIVLELTYILVELDGVKRIELDKTNGTYKINGVDVLAPVRNNT